MKLTPQLRHQKISAKRKVSLLYDVSVILLVELVTQHFRHRYQGQLRELLHSWLKDFLPNLLILNIFVYCGHRSRQM